MVRYCDWLVEPNEANHRRYGQYYQMFKETYSSCATVLERVTKMGREEME